MQLRLEETHGATRLGWGVRGPDAMMEVWSVPSTGEWTMVQTYSNGTSCIVAIGEHWEHSQMPDNPA